MANKFKEYKNLDLVQVASNTLEEWKQQNVFEKVLLLVKEMLRMFSMKVLLLRTENQEYTMY